MNTGSCPSYNSIPDVESIMIQNNPTLFSPSALYVLPFYFTKEASMDTDEYRNFISNAVGRFHRSRTYKGYKSHLYQLGLDHCQVHGNISSEMANIEMHHMIITIRDIAFIITEHILNTIGYISTFDLVTLLKQEHRENHIPLVMLSLTPHQLYHDDPMFFIHPRMVIGKWDIFLEKYNQGISKDIAFKLLSYFKHADETNETDDNRLLDLRDQILDWSEKNDRAMSASNYIS